MKVIHEISSFESAEISKTIVQEMVFQLSAIPVSGSGSYEHSQTSPSSLWTVNHNLGFYPVVDVLSSGGIIVEAEVVHTTTNQVLISFNTPQTGKVIAR